MLDTNESEFNQNHMTDKSLQAGNLYLEYLEEPCSLDPLNTLV